MLHRWNMHRPLAGMLAFDRNGSGDRASFVAIKYKLGETTLMGSMTTAARPRPKAARV